MVEQNVTLIKPGKFSIFIPDTSDFKPHIVDDTAINLNSAVERSRATSIQGDFPQKSLTNPFD